MAHKRTDAQKYYTLNEEMKWLVDAYIRNERMPWTFTNEEKYKISNSFGFDMFIFMLYLKELKQDIWECICSHIEKYFLFYILITSYTVFWLMVYSIFKIVLYLTK